MGRSGPKTPFLKFDGHLMRQLPTIFLAVSACALPGPELALDQLADVPLPGRATRFDYQAIDSERGHLVIAHMNDASVLVVRLDDGSLVRELTGVPTARGVVVAPEVERIFVTALPNQVVIIDRTSLTEVGRVTTGSAPDGIGWDPDHHVVGVSDQGDGALSLIADAGDGMRTQVPLGEETGNVVYDDARLWFWITVVAASGPDRLVAVDPVDATVAAGFDLPKCRGAHGLRLHPDGSSAFVACEGNDRLVRVDLDSGETSTGRTGEGPDVMAIDPELGWLYVAAESGELVVFDLDQPDVAVVGHASPGDHAHSVAVDPATHRLFFPLQSGPAGSPVLRIMRPAET